MRIVLRPESANAFESAGTILRVNQPYNKGICLPQDLGIPSTRLSSVRAIRSTAMKTNC